MLRADSNIAPVCPSRGHCATPKPLLAFARHRREALAHLPRRPPHAAHPWRAARLACASAAPSASARTMHARARFSVFAHEHTRLDTAVGRLAPATKLRDVVLEAPGRQELLGGIATRLVQLIQ